MKYRKRPIVIEAEKWKGNWNKTIIQYQLPKKAGSKICDHCGKVMRIHGYISKPETKHVVCPGDWIVKGIAGCAYPIRDEIFKQCYEEVSDEYETS